MAEWCIGSYVPIFIHFQEPISADIFIQLGIIKGQRSGKVRLVIKMDNKAQHVKLGKWLKSKRQVAGMTEAQLAKVLGRPPSFIQNYEAGKRLEINELVEVAVALKASLHEAVELVEGKKGKKPKGGKKKAAKI